MHEEVQKCLRLSARSQKMVPTPSGSADHIETTESGHWAIKSPVLGKPACVPLGIDLVGSKLLAGSHHSQETLREQCSAGPFVPLLLTDGAPGFLQWVVAHCVPAHS